MGGNKFLDGVEKADRSVFGRQSRVALLTKKEDEGDHPCWWEWVGELQVACIPKYLACPFWAQAQQVESGSVWSSAFQGEAARRHWEKLCQAREGGRCCEGGGGGVLRREIGAGQWGAGVIEGP